MTTLELIAPQLPALAACLLGVLFCLRLGRALPLGRERRSLSGFGSRGESGTAMLDFVLTFPLFTMIVLIVIQFALMVNARIVVSYAAYAAARSAVVWTDAGMEEAEKHAKAAAEVACLPISASFPGNLRIPNTALFPLFALSGPAGPSQGSSRVRRWLRAGGKAIYAHAATEVEIAAADAREGFGPKDPVTVTVTHHFHLAVPYADGVFGHLWGGSLFGLEVLPIQDSYTLVNEGKVRTEGRKPPGPCPTLRGLLDLLRGLF